MLLVGRVGLCYMIHRVEPLFRRLFATAPRSPPGRLAFSGRLFLPLLEPCRRARARDHDPPLDAGFVRALWWFQLFEIVIGRSADRVTRAKF